MEQEQKYTNKVISAINAGVQLAKDKSFPSFDVPILLRVLFDQDNSMYVNVLNKIGIDEKVVSQMIDKAINESVKTSSTSSISASSDV